MPDTVTSTAKKGQTPLMRQYYSIKDRHPGTVLLFRMGDFYETFGEDAEQVHAVLGITLTKRSSGAASEVSLAGFPHHALETYLPKLVRSGFRVAICEQLESPTKGKKIVDRDVVEIVTPGVTLRDQLLDPREARYLVALHQITVGRGNKRRIRFGVSFADASTGDFKLTEVDAADLENLLRGIGPAEILCTRPIRVDLEAMGYPRQVTSILEDWVFGEEYARSTLTDHFDVHSLKGFGVDEGSAGVTAAGALMHYLQETQKGSIPHVRRIEVYDESEYMSLDVQTLRNLELLASSSGEEGGLVTIIDETRTPMGARMLRSWLVRPLRDLDRIVKRQTIVDGFHSSRETRDVLRSELAEVGDLERISARICTGRATPRDLGGLKRACEVLPKVVDALEGADKKEVKALAERLIPVTELVALITETLVDEPGTSLKDGGVIRAGYSAELDELRALSSGGKQWLEQLKETESAKTGIPSLKIGFNRVFGYYLEVTNVHKDKVPEHFIRKQTLVNAERYITPELKEYEDKILGAEERISQLEGDLFHELRDNVAGFTEDVFSNAKEIARLDVLSSLAEVAVRNRFVRPLMHSGTDLEIEDGRHPVVEQSLPPGEPFIPNSTKLNTETEQILIVTGPNMAGKSVVLRQVGLVVLLAQIGSFVPAKRARVGLVDRIFTRVGASDNLSAGESTFLVEMNETANILNNASTQSLILLDEVGRGTSTFDGLSIAWALVEYLHGNSDVAARTLFATHYHELNELENRLERVRNYRILVQEHNGRVVFLRKMVKGGADHSYGIEVARMAGLPASLLDRSRQILNQLEQQELEVGTKKTQTPQPDLVKDSGPQMSLFELAADPNLQEVGEIIAALDPDVMTPMEALLLLSRLHHKISDE